MLDFEKQLRKLESKKPKVLKKSIGEGEKHTKLDPYKRMKIDYKDLIENEDEDGE